VLPAVAREHLTAAAILPFDDGGGESGPSAAAAGSTLELPGYVYLARGKRIISSQPYCYRESKPWATVDELSQLHS
jgi:hypothetical protein